MGRGAFGLSGHCFVQRDGDIQSVIGKWSCSGCPALSTVIQVGDVFVIQCQVLFPTDVFGAGTGIKL